jgi:acyl-coenzyme A thioesterase PaaI-like protein
MPTMIGQVTRTSLHRVCEESYFAVLDENDRGGRYRASPGTAGPWNVGLQHGGPPSALLVRAAERCVPSGDPPAIGVRVAVEFVGPVPVGEVATAASVVRAARAAVLVDVTVSAQGRVCLHGRVWLVRDRDTSAVAAPLPEPVTVPTGLPDLGGNFPYHDTIEWQTITGSMRALGPGLTWARPRSSLVSGEAMSGLQRVVLVGDSASGISAALDWDVWSFVNVDLDVHLSRPVNGEWVLVDAITELGASGSAMARSTISDVHGPVGVTAQTLVLAPRAH